MVSLSYTVPATKSSPLRLGWRAQPRNTLATRLSKTSPTKHIASVKRKRAQQIRYDSSSDTDGEGASKPEIKRTRYAEATGEADDQIWSDSGNDSEDDLEEVVIPSYVMVDIDECGLRVENAAVADIDENGDEEYAIGSVCSAKQLKDTESHKYLGYPNYSDGFPWDDAEDAVEIPKLPGFQRYIAALPRLIVHPAPDWDESLRITLLAHQLKKRILSGDFTESEIFDLMAQRPLAPTYADLRIPTPELSSDQEEDSDSSESYGFEEEDSSAPARPSTPAPPSDSDSDLDFDSDSDDDEPVYSGLSIAQLLERRELEALGVYPDETY
ncbi:hypothetical protein FRC09_011880 [Ceratobasidium sp. 395]|nr:hypothetical protein FRC09_011880 [Ceratobasidium sp. 395]